MVLALPVIIVGEATAVCVGGRFLVEGDPVIAGGVARQTDQDVANLYTWTNACPITTTTTSTSSTTTTTIPDHCTNESMDEDETGIDCGGSCLPCG